MENYKKKQFVKMQIAKSDNPVAFYCPVLIMSVDYRHDSIRTTENNVAKETRDSLASMSNDYQYQWFYEFMIL